MKKTVLVPLCCLVFAVSAQSAPTKKPLTDRKAAKPLRAAKPKPTAKPKPVAKPATAVAKTNAVTLAATSIVYDGPDNEAMKDLRQVLKGYNAGEIKFEKTELGARNGQEFYLARRAEKTYIKYTSDTSSLENAVYTLLGIWGFHWYGPGEDWFVKPAAISGSDIAGQWRTPTFRNRNFFGTGGLEVLSPNDVTNKFKTDWLAWKRRNRYNADYPVAGHAGQAFYLANRALLDAHPDWFNSEAGKQSGRFKIEVPEAVAAYKSWVVNNAKALTQLIFP